ncbi:MAG TPA: hypothetical protein VEO92_00700, partial [Candidatus Nitrosocosmicus sp.]|nr:hypothetical protein [Candidatus Nitrosocosmicus sp.]
MQRHSYFARHNGGENAKKVAQEVGISLSTLERNCGIYLDKTVQEKCNRKCDGIEGESKKAMIRDVSWRP